MADATTPPLPGDARTRASPTSTPTSTPATTQRAAGSLHAVTWAWWAVCGVLSLQLTPSPSASLVVVGVALLTASAVPRRGEIAAALPLLLGLTIVFIGVRVVLTVLTTHPGGDALFTLPTATLPVLLGGFDVGGTIETAVLLRSLAEGMVVLAVITIFSVFNLVISHAELLRTLPRGLHEVGLVVSIALAFVPSLARSITAVREADRARTGGRRVRRGRAVRTLVPVLEGALERALLLAESMDARGYARGDGSGPAGAGRVAGPVGLVLLAVAFGLVVGRLGLAALVVGVLGVAAVAAGLAAAGRAATTHRYRPRRLTRTDHLALVAVTLAPVGVALAAGLGLAAPYDPMTSAVPPFDPLSALALLALAVPAFLRPPVATIGA